MNPLIPQHKAEQLRAEILTGKETMRSIARRENLPYDLLKDIKYGDAYRTDKKHTYKIHR